MSDQEKLIDEVKTGTLLKYKKRIFKSNWRRSCVSLFQNATIVSRSESDNSSSKGETRIQMTNQTTLVIFGRQLKDVPKKPILPAGYRMEQLLAIGLIHSTDGRAYEPRLTILFHWFLSSTIHELIEWIIAINNSIPDNKQVLTDDDLTMSLVMAGALHYNNLMLLQDSQQNNPHLGDNGDALIPGGETDGIQSEQALNNWMMMFGDGDLDATAAAMDYNFAGDMGCGGDFDDCSAYAAADAFAVF